MANSIVLGFNKQTITLTAIDTDWLWSDTISSTSFPQGISIWSIKFTPAVAGDKCVITDENATTPVMFECNARDLYDDKIEYYPPLHVYKPKLAVASGSYNASARVIITLR